METYLPRKKVNLECATEIENSATTFGVWVLAATANMVTSPLGRLTTNPVIMLKKIFVLARKKIIHKISELFLSQKF